MSLRASTCLAALCAALFACGSDEPSQQKSSARPRGRTHGPVLAKGEVEPEVVAEVEAPEAPADGQPVAPEPEPEEEEDEPERDLGAELRAAFGSPVSCLKPRVRGTDTPAQIRISLEAHFVESGRVTRASASSPHLDDEELRCVRNRASALRLRGPIEDAPRSATTTVVLELQSPEKSGS